MPGRHSRPKKSIVKKVSLGATLGIGASVVAVGTAHAAPVNKWDRIAACESGDRNISGSGRWNLPYGDADSTGGLQIQDRTWADFGGSDIAPHAYQATKAQQIAVAERILAAQGPSAWACNGPGHGIASGALSSEALNSAPVSAPEPLLSAATTTGTGHSTTLATDRQAASGSTEDPAMSVTVTTSTGKKVKKGDGEYKVVKGDTLSSIAVKHHVIGGWKKLFELNEETIKEADVIYPDQQLTLGVKVRPGTARRFRLDQRADQRKMPATWSPAK